MVLIGVITTLAMPAMKSVTRRSENQEIAAMLTHQLNLARDQATRRNRAYQVVISDFNAAIPLGLMAVNEANSNTCQSVIDHPDQLRLLDARPFGRSVLPDIESSIRPFVGLSGWQRGEEGWQNTPLELCINPKGGLFIQSGATFTELIGHLAIGVQQFFGDPLRPLGPPLQVELTFSAGARVKR